jgi:hypothetical protein
VTYVIPRIIVAALVGLAVVGPAEAQGIIKKMKDRARQQAQGRVDRAADEAVDSVSSKAEKAARCLISDAQCIKAAQEAGQPVLVTGPDGQAVSSEDSAGAVAAAAGGAEGEFEQPPPTDEAAAQAETPSPGAAEQSVTAQAGGGGRVIVSEDFTEETVGAPPQRLTVEHGTFVVEEHEGRRWLVGNERGGGRLILELSETLPSSFTLTFDFISHGGFVAVNPFGQTTGAHAFVEGSGIGSVFDGKMRTDGAIPDRKDGVLHHARIIGDGPKMAVHIDESKLVEATAPTLGWRAKRIAFDMAVYSLPTMISAIRVTESAQ